VHTRNVLASFPTSPPSLTRVLLCCAVHFFSYLNLFLSLLPHQEQTSSKSFSTEHQAIQSFSSKMGVVKDDHAPVSFTDSEPKLARESVTPTRSSKEEEGKLEDEPAGAVLGDERKIVGFRWALAVLSMLSSTFLFALDTTVVSSVHNSFRLCIST
jgi:hypothetical protein